MPNLIFTCVFVCCAGGGVQPALRAPRAPVQEAVRGPLPGLRQERQRHAGRLRGAGAAPDGRPDAGLRPVHISKSPDGPSVQITLSHAVEAPSTHNTTYVTVISYRSCVAVCFTPCVLLNRTHKEPLTM